MDTNIWNILCDQSADPKRLMSSLADRDAALVLSPHCWYELAKTFRSTKASAEQRDQKLFGYINEFLKAGVLCNKDNAQLFQSEVLAARSGRLSVDPAIDSTARSLVCELTHELMNGRVSRILEVFTDAQTQRASNLRNREASHLHGRADHKALLQSVAENDLDHLMQAVLTGSSGVALIVQEIKAHFPEADAKGMRDCATALLSSPVGRFAKGFVRSVVYYSWRCAHRNSNRSDLADDMYHVLNASYCDTYVSAELNQQEYAPIILGPDIRIMIYDNTKPADEFLLELA